MSDARGEGQTSPIGYLLNGLRFWVGLRVGIFLGQLLCHLLSESILSPSTIRLKLSRARATLLRARK